MIHVLLKSSQYFDVGLQNYFVLVITDQWDYLALEFNKQVGPGRAREGESLRNKFKALKNKKKPTGDPTCPVEVLRAKRADRAIQNKMGVEDFADDEEDNQEEQESEQVNEEDDDDEEEEEAITSPTATVLATTASLLSPAAVSSQETLPAKVFVKPGKGKVPTKAATNRMGYSPDELRFMANTPSPYTTQGVSSSSSSSKKTIDSMLQELNNHQHQVCLEV